MQVIKTADQWLELVRDARHLKPEKYQEWCFIVGSSGSLEERIELGKKALEMLRPKSAEVVTFNFSRGFITGGRMEPEEERPTVTTSHTDSLKGIATNAVSPTSGDYPMQRGVKRG